MRWFLCRNSTNLLRGIEDFTYLTMQHKGLIEVRGGKDLPLIMPFVNFGGLDLPLEDTLC